MPDPTESAACNNPGHDHHLAHGLNCTDPMAWAKADDDIDPPADVVATPEPCAWRIRPDGECGAPSTTVVWGDDHDEVRYVCAEHLPEALRIGWTTDGPELPAPVNAGTLAGLGHAAEQAQALGDAVARFNALSDTAGNPGAPRPTPGACICGPRGDGTGPYDGDPDPDCPEHGHVYGAAVDPSVFGHGMFAGYTTGPAPGPGVNDVAEMARAAASHYGPVARPGELLSDGLNRIGAKLDAIHALVHGLPHPAVLAQIHERLDRIEYVTENIAAAVDDPPPVDPTLSAMGRVTDWDRTDTEHVIASVLTSGDRPGPVVHEDQAGDLAARIAQALYGETTEMAAAPPPDPYAAETVASIIALADSLEGTPAGDLLEAAGRAMSGHDEGAPTEWDLVVDDRGDSDDVCGPCADGNHRACHAASTDVCACYDNEHDLETA